MTVKSLLAENPDPSEGDIRAALSSNLCRCTGYNQMYEAIRSAIAVERRLQLSKKQSSRLGGEKVGYA